MSEFLGSSNPRPRPEPDQARTFEMLATVVLGAVVLTALYVGRDVFIPIAIAIVISFVLSPPDSSAAALGIGTRALCLNSRVRGAGHCIRGQRRFDPAGFRIGG